MEKAMEYMDKNIEDNEVLPPSFELIEQKLKETEELLAAIQHQPEYEKEVSELKNNIFNLREKMLLVKS